MRIIFSAVVATFVAASPMRSLAQTATAPVEDASRAEARARFGEGVRHLEQQEYDAALAKFKQSVKLSPTRAASQNVGITLKTMGRYDEAADVLEATLRTYPNMKPEDRAVLTDLIAETMTHVGSAVVTSSEPDALVYVDGIERGKTPNVRFRVSAGPHTIVLTKDGFQPKAVTVDVPAARETPFDVVLDPMQKSGRLLVQEERGRVLTVVVDNVARGQTPWEGRLSLGGHMVQLRGADGFGSAPAAVEIREQRTTPLTLVAEEIRCRIRIIPVPATARVAVDGVTMPTGAWGGDLACGGHKVEVSADGFVNAIRVVSLTEEREGYARVELARDPGFERIPMRITTGGALGVIFAPSVGGDPSKACGASCSSPLGLGGYVNADAGVRFGTGFGLAVSGGYLALQKQYDDRTASATPVGRDPSVGTSRDSVTVRGPRVGITASFETGERWRYSARLTGGALFASWASTRDLQLTTTVPNATGVPYAISGVRDEGSLVSPFVAPEVGLGYALTQTITFDVRLAGLFMFGLSGAKSTDQSDKYHAGTCTATERSSQCQGVLQLAPESIFASAVLTGTLSAGATARF